MKKTSLIKSICITTGILAPVVTLGVVSCNKNVPKGEIPIEDLIIEDRALIGLKPDADVSKYDTLKVPKEVVEVSSYAFNNGGGLSSNIQNIVFEEGDDILYISSYAFYNCQYIENIKFAQRTEFVDDNAFNSCSSLKTLDFSSWEKEKIALTSPFAEANIFESCPASGQLILPDECDEEAFYMLSGTGLKPGWFNFAPEIKSDTDTNSYYYVGLDGNYCFAGLINPMKGNKVTEEGKIDETTYVVPSIYEKIAPKAFQNVFGDLYFGSIKNIEFEEDSLLEKIGFNAFALNTKLKKVDLSNCLGLKIIDVGSFRGRDTSLLETVILPDSLENIGSYAFYGNNQHLENVDLEETHITKIGVGAFANCANLKTLDLPTTTKWISALAVSGNTILKKIEIPSTIEYIGASAFAGCPNVTEVSFGDGEQSIKYIGSKAFFDCGISTFYIPTSVKYIGDGAFSGNPLSAITVNNNENYKLIASETLLSTNDESQIIAATTKFGWNFNITEKERIASINAFAFYKMTCSSSAVDLTPLTNLKIIKNNAFSNIKNGQTDTLSIQLPGSIEKVGSSAFASSAFNKVFFPETTNSISLGSSVFKYCAGLDAVEISANISTIPPYAFDHCTNIKDLTISSSVKKIEKQAFFCCRSVKNLHLESFDAVPNWDDSTAFSYFGPEDGGLTCFIKNEEQQAEWKALFTKLKVDTSKWNWNWTPNNN